MPSEFRQSTAHDLPAILKLLQAAFKAPPDAPFLDRKRLEWKYFAPILEENRPRSYVLADGENLLAHGCAWPVRVAFPDRQESGVCLLDWVAAPGVPGVGVHFVSKLAEQTDFLISIGGSDDTKRLMPRIGFGFAGEQDVYARVLRPWRRFRRGPAGVTLKEVARLAVNSRYALRRLTPPGAWTARQTESPSANCMSRGGMEGAAVSVHSAGLIALLLRCPGVDLRCFELRRGDQEAGYLVSSFVRGQSRIAEVQAAVSSDEDWAAAVSVAVEAARHPEACEIIAYASTPALRRALEANGFRWRGRRPMFVRPAGKIGGLVWDLTMLDDDAAYLDVGESPFAT